MKINPNPNISLTELKEWVDYDPETGILTWKKDYKSTRPHKKGERCGLFKCKEEKCVTNYKGFLV